MQVSVRKSSVDYLFLDPFYPGFNMIVTAKWLPLPAMTTVILIESYPLSTQIYYLPKVKMR